MVDKHLAPGRPPLTQKLLITWGKDDEQAISNAVWLLEIDGNDYSSLKWRKVFAIHITISMRKRFSVHTYALDTIYAAAFSNRFYSKVDRFFVFI